MPDFPHDLHALEPEDFYAEVHSFEHGFGAVADYLSNLDHGHRSDIAEGPMGAAERDRLISTLCSYAVAETTALETMEFTVFQLHARVADPVTRNLLERILRDERRHIGFGENELGRRLRQQPKRRLWLGTVKSELDPLVLQAFEETLEELHIPREQRPSLGRDYLQAVERLGLT